MKHCQKFWRLLGQHAFSKLECQPCWVCAAFLHGVLNGGDNVPVSQFDGRDVNRKTQRGEAVQIYFGCKAGNLASAPVTDIKLARFPRVQ